MTATLWDNFERLLHDAEKQFLDFHFSEALDLWRNYYRITARVEYETIIREIAESWDEETYTQVPSLSRLFSLFMELRSKRLKNEIGAYTFTLYKNLLIKIYREQFRFTAQNEMSVDAGVFEYLSENYESAAAILQEIVQQNPEQLIARIFLGYAYEALKDHQSAITVLSQNLFLAADELQKDELYLSQFKMLAGRLHSQTGNWRETAWLLTFEAWYRNYLIIKEDLTFFRIMQQKENNERILQVKYYAYERYRHFVRSLFLADYTRLYDKKNRGFISEQEANMAKLDSRLFARYRKKRKDFSEPAKQEEAD